MVYGQMAVVTIYIYMPTIKISYGSICPELKYPMAYMDPQLHKDFQHRSDRHCVARKLTEMEEGQDDNALVGSVDRSRLKTGETAAGSTTAACWFQAACRKSMGNLPQLQPGERNQTPAEESSEKGVAISAHGRCMACCGICPPKNNGNYVGMCYSGTDLGLPNFDCSFYKFLLPVTMVMDGMDEGELLESQTLPAILLTSELMQQS